MLQEFSNELYAQLENDLEQIISNEKELLKRMSTSLIFIKKAMLVLKEKLRADPFKSKNEEIQFFKEIKPRFYALQIYHIEKFNLANSIPSGDAETLKNFYKDELKAIQRFFQQSKFHYQYYRFGATELDELYFIRGSEIQSVLIPEVPELDPEFSTSCDYIFSKIIAYERLQDDVLKSLLQLDSGVQLLPTEEKELPELKWTGDKVNLVEVIYALYFTGQLNHGNADIALIIRFMEKHLQIDLSRAYRDFIDIRNRKVSSLTRYIDQMRESIHKRNDDDLALKTNKNSNKPSVYK